MKGEVLSQIEEIGFVPVVKINNAKDAPQLAKALCEGGVPCAEITFRTQEAPKVIKSMKTTYPEMLVGAGTVLTTQQVDEAMEAGAQFIVSPGFDIEIVKYCQKKNIPIYPGCATASEITLAIKCGLPVIKFFPAEQLGGVKMMKSLSAPYTNIRFMPTGGISKDNICEYLKEDCVVACGGSWVVPTDLIDDNKFEEIKKLAEQAMYTINGFRLAHVGINCEDVIAAKTVAGAFESMFGFTANEHASSIFSAGFVESLKSPYLGENGHIAIAVNSVERAKAYLERKGVIFNEKSAVYRPSGKIQAVYMENEVGGFAIHLVRNS